MELDYRAFAYIISLAAVVNGLGIVRLLSSFAEYLRKHDRLKVSHYWVYTLWVALQFLLHIIMWWMLWGVREVDTFNFIIYLYVLAGHTLMYLATSLLIPDADNNGIDLREFYFRIRGPYFTILSLLWFWAIFMMPVLQGRFAPTVPIMVTYLGIALLGRFTRNPRIHAAMVIAAWLTTAVFVSLFIVQFGGVAESIAEAS